MKPIDFPQRNMTLMPAKGNEDSVIPLYVNYNGIESVSCWQLSDEELAEINKTKCIYIHNVHGENRPAPISANIFSPFTKHATAFCMCFYEEDETGDILSVWNSGDISIPGVITFEGKVYYFSEKNRPLYLPGYALDKGGLFFRMPNDYEVQKRIQNSQKEFEQMCVADKISEDVQKQFAAELPDRARNTAILCRRLAGGKDEMIC